jgi:hypothetical protein
VSDVASREGGNPYHGLIYFFSTTNHRIYTIVFISSYSIFYFGILLVTHCIFMFNLLDVSSHGNYSVHFTLSFSSLHFIIDHVWTNAPTQQCIYGVLEAYWTDHKPIYFTFKLPNYVPQYCHVN